MKLEPNNKSLSFADFLEAAFRDKADRSAKEGCNHSICIVSNFLIHSFF